MPVWKSKRGERQAKLQNDDNTRKLVNVIDVGSYKKLKTFLSQTITSPPISVIIKIEKIVNGNIKKLRFNEKCL